MESITSKKPSLSSVTSSRVLRSRSKISSAQGARAARWAGPWEGAFGADPLASTGRVFGDTHGLVFSSLDGGALDAFALETELGGAEGDACREIASAQHLARPARVRAPLARQGKVESKLNPKRSSAAREEVARRRRAIQQPTHWK